MTLTDLLEKVSGRLRQREGSALDQLAAAAAAHAAGAAVDIGAVEAALVDARLEIDDFGKMCEQAVTRAAKVAEFTALAAAQTRLDRVQGEIAAADAKLEEARAAHARQYEGLFDRRLAAERDVASGKAARDWLIDPQNVQGAIRAEYEAAIDRVQLAESERGRIERLIRETKEGIRSEAGWVRQLAGDQARDLSATDPHTMRAAALNLTQTVRDKIADHERRQKKFEAKLVDLEAELVAAGKEVASATAEVDRIRSKILKAK